jgi:hypothetical protein
MKENSPVSQLGNPWGVSEIGGKGDQATGRPPPNGQAAGSGSCFS